MRIIGGRAGGRRLSVPPQGTRPTTDRVREALFSSLDAQISDWSTVRVLDLFAGSGAVGLEALSRGALAATLVERDRRAAAVLRRNVDAVGLPGAEVIVGDAAHVTTDDPYDLVYADPPYGMGDAEVAAILDRLRTLGALAPGAIVVVEREVRSPAPWPVEGWVELRRRDYGESTLWYGQITD